MFKVLVSILVVVDSLLQPHHQHEIGPYRLSFNPCCSGFIIATVPNTVPIPIPPRFNPCCSGFIIATRIFHKAYLEAFYVSILVVVDSLLQPSKTTHLRKLLEVSILVVVDSLLQPAYG